MTTANSARRYAWGVASRTAAAIFGGYALAAAVSLWVESLLVADAPSAAHSAAVIANMVFFLVYGAAVVWGFAAADARRAWAWIAGPAAALGIALLVWSPASGGAS